MTEKKYETIPPGQAKTLMNDRLSYGAIIIVIVVAIAKPYFLNEKQSSKIRSLRCPVTTLCSTFVLLGWNGETWRGKFLLKVDLIQQNSSIEQLETWDGEEKTSGSNITTVHKVQYNDYVTKQIKLCISSMLFDCCL